MLARKLSMDEEQAREIAERIAAGHAFDLHVLEGEEFPEITTREAFAVLIQAVLLSPTSLRKELLRCREAWWNETHRTLVILDWFSEGWWHLVSTCARESILSSDDIRSTMEIHVQEADRLTLRLGRDDIGHWNNALNEVCNGFVVANFQAAIGIPEDRAAILMEKLYMAAPDNPETFSLDELLALRNALTTVLAELDSREYLTRMGFTIEEGKQMRNALDFLAGQLRFHQTA